MKLTLEILLTCLYYNIFIFYNLLQYLNELMKFSEYKIGLYVHHMRINVIKKPEKKKVMIQKATRFLFI